MWTQGLISFLLWMAYGVYQCRRSAKIRLAMARRPRTARVFLGAGSVFGGMVALFGGFIAVNALGGFKPSWMTPLGWLLITVLGFVFVHLQTLGTAMLVSLSFD